MNAAAGPFATTSAGWSASTSNAQAQQDAEPLLKAFQRVREHLVAIAAAYPPAGDDLRAADAAVEALDRDLSDLANLEAIGVSAWRADYEADLAKLSEASNRVRSDLGLPPRRG